MKRLILCLTVFLCVLGTYSFASEKVLKNLEELTYKKFERFMLFTKCAPVPVIVAKFPHSALKSGVTEKFIRNVVESRLRSARLYRDIKDAPSLSPLLNLEVRMVGRAFWVSLELHKRLIDPWSAKVGIAPTWGSTALGLNLDKETILSQISQFMDDFLNEYLRVNEEACRKKQ